MAKSSLKKRVNFRLHPRVFDSLGSDLVTSDYVAITEIVKNAYDAFADRVDISFHEDEEGPYLEIQDNGQGMSRDTVENVWVVVATPYRTTTPIVRKGKKTRRVSGEKGLGRLSVARLGERLEMLTQTKDGPCIRIEVAWSDFSSASDLSECVAEVSELRRDSPFEVSGTLLRIRSLRSEWTTERLDELEDHLARLLSPFRGVDDFDIRLRRSESERRPAKIAVPEFLNRPKYRVSADLDDDGNLCVNYEFAPVSEGARRKKTVRFTWQEVREQIKDSGARRILRPTCGPFTLEVRAWDIGSDDVLEIAERFDMQRSDIRASIRAHKGISVYRDGILVLPKSEANRDWLGLDIRRVSELGTRLSTSQIIGYVSVTAEGNPRIRDTSDRERLVDCPEVILFEELIRVALGVMQREREFDRLEKRRAQKKIDELFGGLSVEPLTTKVNAVVQNDGSAKDTVPLIADFGRELEKTKVEIERRFVYYSQLATVGTLAQMLVHEVRNKTTTIGAFLDQLTRTSEFKTLPQKVQDFHARAANSVTALDGLAKTFAPLANRSYKRGRRFSVAEERITGTLALLEKPIKDLGIEIRFKAGGSTPLNVDPGEFDTALFNILDNAVYWLSKVDKDERKLEILLRKDKSGERLKIGIHDTGPGVSADDAEKIFWPGVTFKPNGIGMGLTIASEIVSAHEGQMALAQPGLLGGASFEFDFPIKLR
jgi:signal transduction histidine kinase